VLYISPSRIARYFYHECERYLVYTATPKDEREARGIPKPPYDYSPITKAILDGGYAWEEEVLKSKITNKVHKAKADRVVSIKDMTFDELETLKVLKKISGGEYLYQGCFIAPESFYKTYRLDKRKIHFTHCYPDLIFAEKEKGILKFKVIDVKASDEMKTSHKVQVTLYALLLSHIIKGKGINGEADLSAGGVWTYGKDSPQWFNMDTIRPQVEEMLSVDLPGIADNKPEDVFWHLHYRCEWCEYYSFCREEAENKKSVSLLPYLTSHGRKHLLSDEIQVEDLYSMEKFLKRKEAEELLSRCASLSGKCDRLSVSVKSLLDGKVRPFGGSSISMPVGENIRLILSLQREPVSGKIYAAALLRTGNDDIFASKNRHEEQFAASSMNDCERVRKDFLTRIYEIFSEIHAYNEGKDWAEQKSLQTYLFDSYEWDLLRELLMESMKDASMADKALKLLFYFHSEDLVTAEEHPDDVSTFPVIIVTGVVRSLFAIPVPVAYQLSAMVDIFPPAGRDPFSYKPGDYFAYRLSNAMRADAIHSVWHQGKREPLEWIGNELKKRLWATSSVINGVKDAAIDPATKKSLLFAWPPKFSFPPLDDFKEATLSRLAFITKYESVLKYLEKKSARALPRQEREKAGIAYALKYNDNSLFSLDPVRKERVLECGDTWLLSEDTPEGDRSQMTFPDFLFKNKPWVPGNKPVWYADIAHMEEDKKGGTYSVTLSLKNGKISPVLVPGNYYLLQPRLIDYTTDWVNSRLKEIDAEDKADTVKLLENPLKWCSSINEPEKFRRENLKIIKKMRLTPSQEGAFCHVLDNTLTLVWGPPGTGKTHFIAITILCLLESHRTAGKPFRILLSAFTHAAIENCLKKLLELNKKLNIWKEDAVVKLKSVQTQGSEDINVLPEGKCIRYLSGNERCIIGGTTYSAYKVCKKDPSSVPFDMAVLDEGSQVRVPDSLLAISRLKPGGRLLIAGDDKQLPPIIQGSYPTLEKGEPLLHRSIFEALREPDREKNLVTSQLLENFRMNKTLCLYPAKQVYGSKYRSAAKNIETRKLLLDPLSVQTLTESQQLLEAVLDPDCPVTVCVIEGIRTGAENPLEAGIAADLTLELRKRLCSSKTGKPYPDTEEGDRLFWKEGLFVVSPHHAQIKSINTALKERGLREPYFVDTVDKMQGQECDAVIVSYGVADPELAMREGEFIYSLNRLNVSITRARVKSIVFLSRYLLTPTLQVLEDPEAVEPISYMIGLERFAKESKNLKLFPLDNNGKVSIMVYGR